MYAQSVEWVDIAKPMRPYWLLALMPLAANAAGLQLDVSGGYAQSDTIDEWTPLVRARAGVDLAGWFTPSVSWMGALFQDPHGFPSNINLSGNGIHAWGVAAELRLHSPGQHQLAGAFGAGWGNLAALQPAPGGDIYGFRGHPAPYVEASVGYRYVNGQFRVGADFIADGFNRVDLEGDAGTRGCPPSACPTHETFWLRGFALVVGWGQ